MAGIAASLPKFQNPDQTEAHKIHIGLLKFQAATGYDIGC